MGRVKGKKKSCYYKMSSPKADMACRPAVIPHRRELGLYPSLCSVTGHKLPWKGGEPGPGGCIKSDRQRSSAACMALPREEGLLWGWLWQHLFISNTHLRRGRKNLPYSSTSLCHQENLIKANGGKLPEYDKKNLHKAHKKHRT